MNMMTPLTYLTCPYSHRDPAVLEARFSHATRACAWLISEFGWNCFSPITHSHPLHQLANMRGDWAFWSKIDYDYLNLSERLVNLMLPGWQDSVGVTAENKIMRGLQRPILYLAVSPAGIYSLYSETDFENLAKHV